MWAVHLFCVAFMWCLRTFPVLLKDFSFGHGTDMELDSMRSFLAAASAMQARASTA